MKIKWDEPAEFNRAYIKSMGMEPTRKGRFMAAIITAIVIDLLVVGFWGFFYLLHKKDLGVPTYTYFVAPAIAGVFVYFLPVMLASSRCVIVLTEKGIHRHKNVGTATAMELWPWDSITALAVEEVQYGKSVHRVLVVRSSLEPVDILLGLGDTPLDRIEPAIIQMGKTLKREKK